MGDTLLVLATPNISFRESDAYSAGDRFSYPEMTDEGGVPMPAGEAVGRHGLYTFPAFNQLIPWRLKSNE